MRGWSFGFTSRSRYREKTTKAKAVQLPLRRCQGCRRVVELKGKELKAEELKRKLKKSIDWRCKECRGDRT